MPVVRISIIQAGRALRPGATGGTGDCRSSSWHIGDRKWLRTHLTHGVPDLV
jgi:hypothetical protein